MIEFTSTMLRTLATVITHSQLTGDTVVLSFNPDTPEAETLLICNPICMWSKGNFPGERDFTVNMTADESTLKQMAGVLFDD